MANIVDPPIWLGEAVQRARSAVNNGGQYILGTGDYAPKAGKDEPWTAYYDAKSPWYKKLGSDCAGFAISWCWKLKRHRPGFNRGPWASVSDDINCNSAREDGLHEQALFTTLPPESNLQPGDLLLYPTIRVSGKTFIGHVGLIEAIPYDFKWGDWSALTIIQCRGPNGRAPGVVRTDGSIWEQHDSLWSKPEHASCVVRPKERK